MRLTIRVAERHQRIAKLAGGTLLAVVVATVPLGADPDQRSSGNCGGLNFAADIAPKWTDFGEYTRSNDLLLSGDPVGLYRSVIEGQDVALLDFNRPGSVSKIDHLVPITTDEYVSAVEVDRERVLRTQNYLSTTNFAGDENTSNAAAMQLEIWANLGQLDLGSEFNRDRDDTDTWLSAVGEYAEGIGESAALEPFVPDQLNARFYRWQWADWLSVRASLTAAEGAQAAGQVISMSTVATSARESTDETGETVLHVPNPGRGWAQQVGVDWQGVMPAGAILKAQYEKGITPKDQAFFVTAAPSVVGAHLVLSRPPEACYG